MAKSQNPSLTKYQTFDVLRVSRSKLLFMPGNPQGMDDTQTAALAQALDVNGGGVGLLQTIVVNKRTWHIVGGNHRVREIDGLECYDEATHANDYSIDVAAIDVGEDRERAIVLALNNPRLQGQPRIDALRMFLEAVPDDERKVTGFTADDCAFLLGNHLQIDEKKIEPSIGSLLWGSEPVISSFDVKESLLPDLNSGDREPFQQMTFTLHDSQVRVINEAMAKAKQSGPFDGSPNDNGNGNALARIAESYCGKS